MFVFFGPLLSSFWLQYKGEHKQRKMYSIIIIFLILSASSIGCDGGSGDEDDHDIKSGGV